MQLINEVPLEEEEGESQDVMGKKATQDQQYEEAEEPQDDLQGLSDEQLIELLQNANQLSPQQQAQLQQILKTRWKKDLKTQKKEQYANIYNILTENVLKAK